jgi:hypothetical protein
MHLKYTLSLIVLLLSQTCNAGGGATSTTTINQISLFNNGTVLSIYMDAEHKNPDNCTSNKFYVIEAEGNGQFDRLMSFLQSSFIAKTNTRFWLSGCSKRAYWNNTYPVIRNISLEQ